MTAETRTGVDRRLFNARSRWVAPWLAAVCLSMATAAAAQEPSPAPAPDEPSFATRAEADRARREAKALVTRPHEPNRVEQAIDVIEDRALFLLDREGFYPKLGSLSVSSGFAYGLGYRDRDLFQNQGALDFWGAGSVRGYWAVESRMSFPRLAGRRLRLEAFVGHRDFPEENFFGLGPDARRDNRSDYAIKTTNVGGRATARLVRPFIVGGEVEYLRPRVRPGTNDRFSGIEDVFPPEALPGIESRSDFLRSTAFVEVDYREPTNARRGGWYRVDFQHYDDRTDNLRTFNRTDVDLRQFVGVLGDRRVLAVRAYASTSDTDPGQIMPFYFMPTLGGNDTLRGFRAQRFRGPHSMLLQAEYRWEIWSALDAALFYDTGKVANRRSDLDFENLESDYGFGFRFNTSASIILRVDAAFGSRDGKHLHIVFGGIF